MNDFYFEKYRDCNFKKKFRQGTISTEVFKHLFTERSLCLIEYPNKEHTWRVVKSLIDFNSVKAWNLSNDKILSQMTKDSKTLTLFNSNSNFPGIPNESICLTMKRNSNEMISRASNNKFIVLQCLSLLLISFSSNRYKFQSICNCLLYS